MRGQALFGLSSHIYSLKETAESSAVKRMNPRWIQNEPPIILVPFYCDAFRRTDASYQHASRIPPVLPASARRTKTQDFKQNLSSGIQPANQNMLPARLVTRMRVIEGSFEAKLQTIKEPKDRRNAEGGLINTYRRIKLNNLES